MRLGALLVAAFGGALTLTIAGDFQVGGGLAFLAFACALGAELFLARTSPPHNVVRRPSCGGVGQDARLAIHGARRALRARHS